MAQTLGEIERRKGYSIYRVITDEPFESTRVYKVFMGTRAVSPELQRKGDAQRYIDTLAADL